MNRETLIEVIALLNTANYDTETLNQKRDEVVSVLKDKLKSSSGDLPKETLKCEICNFQYELKELDNAPNGDLVCKDCTF